MTEPRGVVPVPPLDRRTVLTLSALSAAALSATALDLPAGAVSATDHARRAAALPAFSDPASWGGVRARAGAPVVIDRPVRLDRSAVVDGLVIEPRGRLVFDPRRSVALVSTGNVEVRGTLEMSPRTAAQRHLLRFDGVDEAAFTGGGMDVVDGDTGLWVVGRGRVFMNGAARTAWVRSARALPAGSTTISLLAPPTGWRAGDELVVTPTGAPSVEQHERAFDTARVLRVSGRTVALDRPLVHDHPLVTVGDGIVLGAEVLNLTRNVSVEGTAGGRTHVWIRSAGISVLRYASIRHFGPRQVVDGTSEPVLGRYGLHWHMAGDATRGTVVEGVVARDGGSHAFVTHASHGVTYRSCISHDTVETAYWWDLPPDTRTTPPASDAISYQHCVASLVKAEPTFRGFRLAGFNLGFGRGNSARGCIAVGVRGNVDASGFHWPEGSDSGVWAFRDCLAHNNAVHGLEVWQNSPHLHVVERFVGYHNGRSGISHGAYRNRYLYRDSVLFGNGASGVELHANSLGGRRLHLDNLLVDGGGLSAFGIQVVGHTLAAQAPTRVERCRIRGCTTAAVGLTGADDPGGSRPPSFLDVSGGSIRGNAFWFAPTEPVGSGVRLQLSGDRAYAVSATESDGSTYVPEWDAYVVSTTPFRSVSPPRRTTTQLPTSAPASARPARAPRARTVAALSSSDCCCGCC